MKSFIAFLSILMFFSFSAISQCDYFDDFSSSGDWTQVGTLVEVSGGELQYIDGAPDGVQRRVYKELDEPITSGDCWTMNLEFTPQSVGSYQEEPFTGHLIFALTETDQDPIHDCPNVNCTGYPPGTQDMIGISYWALNPPDGNLIFRIYVRNATTEFISDNIIYNELGNVIYVELIYDCDNSNLELNIYSDENHQNPIGDGPVSLDVPELNDFYYVQHGNHSGGWHLRELTGTVDNVCIDISGDCTETFGEETYEGCEGDGYSVEVNGTIYDENNPTGTEVMENVAGCDSIITINLIFYPNSFGEETYEGCEGDGYSVVVNGTTYDEENPTGTEVLTNANGCDSTVTINLVFYPETYGEETYEGCEGDGYSVVVNGTTYDEENPTGTEVLTNANGCDSIVTINLIFYPETFGEETYEGCEGDGYSVVVNGTTYDEENPTGTEVLTNANGCDSTVTINLIFLPNSYGEETYEGCEGDGYSIEVNGTIYDEENPTGTEYFTAANGCDSIVSINLIFLPNSFGEELYEGCEGDGYFVIVNDNIYDEDIPEGIEVLESANGCDSTVTIDLNFYENTTGEELYEGCEGDGYFVIVNGNIYDEDNPTGMEVLTNSNGCDSTVTINLNFYNTTYGEENYEGCEGDGYTIEINGTTYDENNPSGLETLVNINGCDSLVTIDLVYYPNSYSEIYYEGCEGDGFSIEVNGTTYDENNSSGTEIMTNANGCDSIIMIGLNYYEVTYGEETYEGCKGDGYSVIVNGTTYDEANPTGVDTLTNSNGCDSIVNTNLIFNESTSAYMTYESCSGGGFYIVINGVTYDESNPTGVDTTTNVNGCDSIISVNLVFFDILETDIFYEGCKDDGYSLEVNGKIYDESNPSGIDTLESVYGCDSIVAVSLVFYENTTGEVSYEGCEGDGYSVVVGNNTYDEDSPNGIDTLVNSNGCDSIVKTELIFHDTSIIKIYYRGKKGDGYEVKVKDKVYNEENPTGVDTLQTIYGCDSIIIIDLVFDPVGVEDLNTEKIMEIYPNPTKDNIFIKCNINNIINNKVYYYKIILPDGKIIRKDITGLITDINLRKFNLNGVYFIQLVNENGSTLGIEKVILVP